MITKNKKKFLHNEYKFYKPIFKYYVKFEYVMLEDAVKCKNCGVYYWDGCEKRCSC